MPFAIYLPFYPGQQPNLIFSREAEFDDYDRYVALGDRMTTADVFRDQVPREGPILDAGCGWGRWSIRLHRDGRRMIGLDLHMPALERLHGFAPRLPVIRGAVAGLPFRDDCLSGVVSLGVVEHAEEGPSAALREFARVLRPGGRLLVSTPYNNLVRRLIFNPLFSRYNTRRAGRGYYFVEYRYSRNELARAIEDAGLRLLGAYPHDFEPPLSMGLTADRNILSIRFVRKPEGMQLEIPDLPAWRLSRWPTLLAAALHRLSPWLAAAEILMVAEKPGREPHERV